VDGIWAFVAMTVLLSVSPGPDDVLVLRSSLRGGPRLGLAWPR
jgi:threonine/homoserine/homoserine lactone efflux protein